MKLFVSCIVLFTSIGANIASNLELTEVRSLYYASAEDFTSAKKFVERVQDITAQSQAVLQGYKGMGFMLLSKHKSNPFEKLNYFKQGTAWLESAIKQDSSNIELIFLRYTIQTNAPFFLGYSSNIHADLGLLRRSVRYMKDEDLQQRISEYISIQDI